LVEGSGRSVGVQGLHSVSQPLRIRRLALGFVNDAVLRSDNLEVVFRRIEAAVLKVCVSHNNCLSEKAKGRNAESSNPDLPRLK